MKEGQEKYWNEQGLKNTKKLLDNAYASGFHHGRHKERDMLSKSGYLQIKPEKLEELKLLIESPCINCVNRSYDLKVGCTKDLNKCPLKQQQFAAIEIYTYFNIK